MAKAKTEDDDVKARLIELEAFAAELKRREEAIAARESAANRGRTAATTPLINRPPEDVLAITRRATEYLSGKFYRPGAREIQMIEAIAWAMSKHKGRTKAAG